jgi:hypothetical protein
MRNVPGRLSGVVRTIRKARTSEYLKFTEGHAGYSVSAALKFLYGASMARKALEKNLALAVPPSSPYVLFGLHFQPESSIDVWAPFFSNQMWVIELLSRSIPPSHKLLVKIHKSDVANYSTAQLTRMRCFPGVELVRPFANTRDFIENADLIVAIQGTMGLEGALLGKRVIMLGDSPVAAFPSVSRIGEISNLPQLIRDKLGEPPPSRSDIIDAYATYLAPFERASHNDWTATVGKVEIDGYRELFGALTQYLATRSGVQ